MEASPLHATHLSVAQYADVMQINPLHAAGVMASGYFTAQPCSRVLPRYSWQGDNVSQAEVALAINTAEVEFIRILNRFAGPDFVEWEEHEYPGASSSRNTMFGENKRYKVIQLAHGDLIKPGVRKVSSVELAASVTYTDDDGDGLPEIATVTVSGRIPANEVRVFFAGTDAQEEWRVDHYSHSFSGNTTVLKMRPWHLADPEVMAFLPKDQAENYVDITDSSNLVDTVDVYREWCDWTTSHVKLYYNGSRGYTGEANGFARIRHKKSSLVEVHAGYYDQTQDEWVIDSTKPMPDRVEVSYRAGMIRNRWAGWHENPVPDDAINIIKMLATARLYRPILGCPNIAGLAETFMEDMALVSPQGNFLAVADVIQECPLGTRRGEWLAWNEMKNMDRHVRVAIA